MRDSAGSFDLVVQKLIDHLHHFGHQRTPLAGISGMANTSRVKNFLSQFYNSPIQLLNFRFENCVLLSATGPLEALEPDRKSLGFVLLYF
jgi:hypothetical protein